MLTEYFTDIRLDRTNIMSSFKQPQKCSLQYKVLNALWPVENLKFKYSKK